MITFSTLQTRRDDILNVARHWGASDVRVFGSVARNDTGHQSDVDFLVRFDTDRSLLDHGGLLMDLQDLLGCPVDLVSEEAMRPRLRERIVREARPL